MRDKTELTIFPRAIILAGVMLIAYAFSLSANAQIKLPKTAPARSTQNISSVFDTNKSLLFETYNRFLKENPTLSGKIVLELHIAPSGIVTECLVAKNGTNSEAFQEALVNEVRKFDFGAQDVAPMIFKYPIDFLPY
jgi:TonB family protein